MAVCGAVPFVVSVVCLCVVAVAFVGCGGGDRNRAIVTGTVTYQGEPLPSGRIVLLPAKGTKAPQSGAEIVDGKFTVDARGGVAVGTYQVQITAQRVDPKYAELGDSLPADFQDIGGPPMQQYLPEKYNIRSEMESTIPPGARRMTPAFDLD
ncbi:MAG: hypothetical protein RBS80_11485 [Thermoguttaceae bacterium]|jgi:hypothetical protein|nr:hypothetical protein [Thermoguttaceae bacterium]